MVRNWGTKCMRSLPRPKLTNMIWGAGLSFSKCHAEKKVPVDPHTPHIFDGEEFSKALRLWTWGYDIYSPHRVYVVHNYHESQSDPKHSQWAFNVDPNEQFTVVDSVRRLKMLMGMETDVPVTEEQILTLRRSRFGLGDRRTLEQAIAFSGIDTKNRVMTSNRCGNLEYVPFVQHPKGAAHIPSFSALDESPLELPDPGSIYYDPQQHPKLPADVAAPRVASFVSGLRGSFVEDAEVPVPVELAPAAAASDGAVPGMHIFPSALKNKRVFSRLVVGVIVLGSVLVIVHCILSFAMQSSFARKRSGGFFGSAAGDRGVKTV